MFCFITKTLISWHFSFFFFDMIQKIMNLFMQSGPQKGVQYADGLKIGTTIKLLYALGMTKLQKQNLSDGRFVEIFHTYSISGDTICCYLI